MNIPDAALRRLLANVPTVTSYVPHREVIARRLWAKVRKGKAGQCWRWRGAFSGGGWPVIWTGTRLHYAQRVAVALTGEEVEAGEVIEPACGHRWCMNPAHWRRDFHTRLRKGDVMPRKVRV
jgi:hypothetical protein